MQTSMQNCPFCQKKVPISSHDHDNNTLFRCSECGLYLVSRRVLELFDENRFVERKAKLLHEIKASPSDKLPLVRYRLLPGEVAGERLDVYVEYRP